MNVYGRDNLFASSNPAINSSFAPFFLEFLEGEFTLL